MMRSSHAGTDGCTSSGTPSTLDGSPAPPGAATLRMPSFTPPDEYAAGASFRSVAVTQTTPGTAAGSRQVGSDRLPADATTTTPLLTAQVAASMTSVYVDG
jgi:hypothetical protein